MSETQKEFGLKWDKWRLENPEAAAELEALAKKLANEIKGENKRK